MKISGTTIRIEISTEATGLDGDLNVLGDVSRYGNLMPPLPAPGDQPREWRSKDRRSVPGVPEPMGPLDIRPQKFIFPLGALRILGANLESDPTPKLVY